MSRRTALGAALVLHGLGHAGPGTWASGRGPVELVAILWWVASLAFVLAGFRLLHWPAPRLHPYLLALAAAAASLPLLLFAGSWPVALVGAALDLILADFVRRWTREWPVYAADGSLVRGTERVRRRRRRQLLRRLAAVPATIALAWLSASILLRPWHTTWGTTAGERAMTLPGDGLVPGARYVVEHAISIAAPADAVWPWLVQMGQDRAGFYSYDWLERAVGDQVHNADEIVPEWQHLAPGDLIRAAQPDYLGGLLGRDIGWRVVEVRPGRALVLRGWGSFVLDSAGPASTRLHVRLRGEGRPSLAAVPLAPFGLLVFEPAHFIMERAMLRGIRARAERLYRERLS